MSRWNGNRARDWFLARTLRQNGGNLGGKLRQDLGPIFLPLHHTFSFLFSFFLLHEIFFSGIKERENPTGRCSMAVEFFVSLSCLSFLFFIFVCLLSVFPFVFLYSSATSHFLMSSPPPFFPIPLLPTPHPSTS